MSTTGLPIIGQVPPRSLPGRAQRGRTKVAVNHQESSNYTLAAGGGVWVDVDDTELSWAVDLTGAPLELEVCAVLGTTASDVRVSMSLDGVEVTGGLGMIYVDNTVGALTVTGKFVVLEPPVGTRVLRVVWQGGGVGTGTMYQGPSTTQVTVIAKEQD